MRTQASSETATKYSPEVYTSKAAGKFRFGTAFRSYLLGFLLEMFFWVLLVAAGRWFGE